MSPLVIGGIVFTCVLGGGLLGLVIRNALPDEHLSADTKDIVKLVMGLIGTMAALVLGLLIASAKSSYDVRSGEVTQMSANVVLLDRVMAHYGPETKAARESLRGSVASAIDRIWPDDRSRRAQVTPTTGAGSLAGSSPPRGSIPMPFLLVLILWLTVILASFGLFAPRNTMVIFALFVCALSLSSAIFLILELDQPFEGLLRISSAPLRAALAQLASRLVDRPSPLLQAVSRQACDQTLDEREEHHDWSDGDDLLHNVETDGYGGDIAVTEASPSKAGLWSSPESARLPTRCETSASAGRRRSGSTRPSRNMWGIAMPSITRDFTPSLLRTSKYCRMAVWLVPPLVALTMVAEALAQAPGTSWPPPPVTVPSLGSPGAPRQPATVPSLGIRDTPYQPRSVPSAGSRTAPPQPADTPSLGLGTERYQPYTAPSVGISTERYQPYTAPSVGISTERAQPLSVPSQ